MVLAAAEPAVVGGAPVGQQQSAAGVEITCHEPGEGRRDVPRSGGEVDHRRPRVRAGQPLIEHRHSGDGGARVLVEHEGVPGGEEGAGQRGDHDRVIHVGDDAERGIGVDDEDFGRHGLGVVGAQAYLAPSRSQVDGDAHVDDAATFRAHSALDGTDRDRHLDIVNGNAEEAAPAPHLRSPLLGGVAAPGQHHAAEHASPPGSPVSGVGDDRGGESASTTAALTPAVERILDARRAMHDLLRRPGGGHGCAGSSH